MEHHLESAQTVDEAIARLTDMVSSLMHDVESLLPHLIETSAAVGLNWALIDGVHRLLNDARKIDGLDDEVRELFVRQLAGMLRSAGVREFGRRGEEFDPVRHEPIEARDEGTQFRVKAVRASGLERAGVVLKRAKVIIERTFTEGPSTSR
jgi:hypothetical protein